MDKTASDSTCRYSRIICLSFSSNECRIVDDPAKFRAYLDAMIKQFPELFPAEITVPFSTRLLDEFCNSEDSDKMKSAEQRRTVNLPFDHSPLHGDGIEETQND